MALANTGCALSFRGGPEARAQPQGAVVEGRASVVAGLGKAKYRERAQYLGIPLSVSGGAGLERVRGEGSFESGLEYARIGERFGFRFGARVAKLLGEPRGGYLGLRGGPLLMLQPVEEGTFPAAVNLEGLVAFGTGDDVARSALVGVCLSMSIDYYSGFNLHHLTRWQQPSSTKPPVAVATHQPP